MAMHHKPVQVHALDADLRVYFVDAWCSQERTVTLADMVEAIREETDVLDRTFPVLDIQESDREFEDAKGLAALDKVPGMFRVWIPRN
jgi:hypothetical protein